MAGLQLQARGGDVQALKACIAAAFSGTPVALKEAGGAATPPSICLSTPEGLKLTEPNAVALYLGGKLLLI